LETFNTSDIADLNEFFGRAPVAICGFPSIGIKSSKRIL
jgi:hypothetical protein